MAKTNEPKDDPKAGGGGTVNIRTSPGTANLKIRTLRKAGTGDLGLRDFPALTYAPSQWGAGVRCAANGALVADIANDSKAGMDPSAIAERYKLAMPDGSPNTAAIEQALRYAERVGYEAGGGESVG